MRVPKAQDARQKLGRKTGLADTYAAKLARTKTSLSRDPIDGHGARVFFHPRDRALQRRSGLRPADALEQQRRAFIAGIVLRDLIKQNSRSGAPYVFERQ